MQSLQLTVIYNVIFVRVHLTPVLQATVAKCHQLGMLNTGNELLTISEVGSLGLRWQRDGSQICLLGLQATTALVCPSMAFPLKMRVYVSLHSGLRCHSDGLTLI